jgi:hypothetical protein
VYNLKNLKVAKYATKTYMKHLSIMALNKPKNGIKNNAISKKFIYLISDLISEPKDSEKLITEKKLLVNMSYINSNLPAYHQSAVI